MVLVTTAAGLSLVSLLTLGRGFGLRPALRRLATTGPYRLVRHPIYLSYVIADVGYNLNAWAPGTVLLVLVGWASLVYRIRAEERSLSQDAAWTKYRTGVPYRLIPRLRMLSATVPRSAQIVPEVRTMISVRLLKMTHLKTSPTSTLACCVMPVASFAP